MTATPVSRSARRRLAALAALAAVACASPGAPGAAAPRLGRIVVAPMNLGLRAPAELLGREAPVWAELLRYLGGQDRALGVVDAGDAAQLWNAAVAELASAGTAPGPQAAASRFAQLLADHADYDMLVMPSLVLRRARVGGRHVAWDGARRALPVRAPLPIAAEVEEIPGVTVSGYEGSIAAASLHVAILDSDGRSLYEGLAGLDVIQEVARGERPRSASEWTLAPRRDSFADAAELREGVERAFARPVR